MDSNQKRFAEDALDLLDELDEGLLQLEKNQQARAPLEQVFRTMHTLKGAANMFEMNSIGKLAHELENLYDLVRQGTISITDELISLTLQAFDRVRDLLKERDVFKINNDETLLAYVEQTVAYYMKTCSDQNGNHMGTQRDELVTFLVIVNAKVKLTEDGAHPLIFIVQDVLGLGTSHCRMLKNETGEIESWEIFLSTTASQNEIESYFLFVDQDCVISFHRLGNRNLFELSDFTDYINIKSYPTTADDIGFFKKYLEEAVSVPDQQMKSDLLHTQLKEVHIKVSKQKVDALLSWMSELIILQARFTNVTEKIKSPELEDANEHLNHIAQRLRDITLEIGLIQIEVLITRFKRLVRDLAKSLDKKVNFLAEGANTEIDKDIIEHITEPLIHIIRNSIDHGIEKPDERRALGKPEHGTVKLKAFTENKFVNIIFTDDGRGINKDQLVEKAIRCGLITDSSFLSEDEIYKLIFHPGLSTAESLSDVSGRGVGMDAVKQKITGLHGQVTVQSSAGKGTSIHIKLPLSRSIIDGMLVTVGQHHYIIPLSAVIKCYETSLPKAMDECQNLILDGELLPVFHLQKIFGEETAGIKNIQVIKVRVAESIVGIAVDTIIGNIQTVLKQTEGILGKREEFAGATILGDGTVALIINAEKLISKLMANVGAYPEG